MPRNKLYPPCIVLKLTSDGRPVYALLPFPSALHGRIPCCCLEAGTGIRMGCVPWRRISGVTAPLPVQTRLGSQWPLWDRSLDYQCKTETTHFVAWRHSCLSRICVKWTILPSLLTLVHPVPMIEYMFGSFYNISYSLFSRCPSNQSRVMTAGFAARFCL